MKQFLSFSILSLTFFFTAYSAERAFPESLSLSSGTVCEDVKLISQTPSEIVFKHSGGVMNVKIAELSEEVQQLLDYSETEALAVDRAQAEKTVLRLKQLAEAEQAKADAKILAEKKKHVFMIRGYVHRVLDDGVLIQAGIATDLIYRGIRVSESEVAVKKYKTYQIARPQRAFGLVYLKGHPRFKYFTDTDLVDVDVYRDEIFRSEGDTLKQFVFLADYE